MPARQRDARSNMSAVMSDSLSEPHDSAHGRAPTGATAVTTNVRQRQTNTMFAERVDWRLGPSRQAHGARLGCISDPEGTNVARPRGTPWAGANNPRQ